MVERAPIFRSNLAATSKPDTGGGKGVRVDKIAKMLIGVENLVVQGVTYDEEQGCIVISARPTRPRARVREIGLLQNLKYNF